MERIRGMRPTYAGVTATLALVLALGMGGAYAAQKITSKAIAPGAVKSKHIKDGHVKAADLGAGSVTTRAIAPDSVRSAQIVNGNVGMEDISAGAVGIDELGLESVDKNHVREDSVGNNELALTLRTLNRNVDNGATAKVTSRCLEGETAIAGGGGFAGVPSGITLATSRRETDGWFVEARNASGSAQLLEVQAFCLDL